MIINDYNKDILDALKNGTELEYYQEHSESWQPFTQRHPIEMLFNRKIRLKPTKVHKIGIYEIPWGLTKKPNKGDIVWHFSLIDVYNEHVSWQSWGETYSQCELLKKGLLYSSKEDALLYAVPASNALGLHYDE